MIRRMAAHPTAPNLLMLAIVAIGVGALLNLQRSTFPDLPLSKIEISALYPGAAPEDVESAVCVRIEDAIDGVEGIDEVVSQALDGIGRVTVTIEEGADIQAVFDDLDVEVSGIMDFPEGVEAPTMRQSGRTIGVASLAVVGDMTLPHLKAHCEDVRTRLLRDKDIEIATVSGFSDHQFLIEVPAHTLLQYGLAATDIADAVRRGSLDMPVGTVETKEQVLNLRIVDERRTALQLSDLVVIGGDAGAELRLGEIATIRETFENPEEAFSYNGRRAGRIEIQKTRAQDSLVVVGALKDFIARENRTQPEGVRLFLTQDNSSIVQDRLDMLITNGWQGFLLVFLTLALFFNIRLAFWVGLGLPVSFLGTFYVMGLVGYSLNMMTMVALLLALGLLMDDGIVLAENIATHLSRGKKAIDAVSDGITEVLGGVLSSFATTIVVFGPLAFLSGDIGAFLRVIPVVLIATLAVSLIDALVILPGHLAHSLHGHEKLEPSRLRLGVERGVDWFRENVLGRAVDFTVRFRYACIGGTLAAFLICMGLLGAGVVKFQAFPETDGDIVVARILMPAGTPLDKTEAVVDRVVDAFGRVNAHFKPAQPGQQDLIKAISVQTNLNSDAGESGPHVATITIDLLSAEIRRATIDAIAGRWRTETGVEPDAVWIRYGEAGLGPGGSPIDIEIRGDDLDECKGAALAVQRYFGKFAGVYDLYDDMRPGRPEERIRMRPGGASLGVDARMLGGQLRTAFMGETASEIRVGTEPIEITVRVSAEDRASVADLESFRLVRPGGDAIPLAAVANHASGRGYARIARVDGQRAVTVKGDVDSRIANVTQLMNTFRADGIADIRSEYPGVNIALRGEVESGNETMNSMIAGFLLGLGGIFILLSFQFRSYVEPLIVMIAIPLCLIGVIVGHMLMGQSITLPSMLGFVSLAGVVVNDSILLVLFLKESRRKGAEIADAARQASRLRFRAVMLTSITTVAGMTPLMLETSLQAQTLIPLAISVVFGLSASTVLVLLVIPALYTVIGDFGRVAPVEADEPAA